MPEQFVIIISGIGGFAAGAFVAYFLIRQGVIGDLHRKRSDGEKILKQAREEAGEILRQAQLDSKEMLIRMKAEFDRETENQRKELQRLEERLQKRQENIERKNDLLSSKEIEISRKEKILSKREFSIKEKEKEKEMLIARQQETLEKIAGMTSAQAKQQLVASMIDEAKRIAGREIKQIVDAAKEEAEKRARDIIATAIQRYSSEVVQERAVRVVNLPSDEMKGRIIGREGRNIRALEASTGVEFIVDDTPESVIISGFDPIRREVARVALEKLVADGRIHPNRIEEVVSKSNEEVQKSIKEAGERALLELGIGRMHPELVKLLGQLRYRYSYAQNVLQHSIEAAFLAGLIAAELRISIRQARRAGLLHDIGKAVSHEVEGSHAVVGAQMAKNMARHLKSSMPSKRITKRSFLRALWLLSSWQRTPLAARDLERGARCLRPTLKESRISKGYAPLFREWRNHLPFRPVGKSGFSSRVKR